MGTLTPEDMKLISDQLIKPVIEAIETIRQEIKDDIKELYLKLDKRNEELSDIKLVVHDYKKDCETCRINIARDYRELKEQQEKDVAMLLEKMKKGSLENIRDNIGKWVSFIITVAAAFVLVYNFVKDDIGKREFKRNISAGNYHETNR